MTDPSDKTKDQALEKESDMENETVQDNASSSQQLENEPK